MKKYVLFSVNETNGLIDFSRAVSSLNWSIVATEKPFIFLRDAGIEVISVADFVGIHDDYSFPPTLHPKIEYALTSKDAAESIELVYDIPYSLDVGNDVGGHTLLALAIKGNKLPIFSYADMREAVKIISSHGKVPDDIRRQFISKANLQIVRHYTHLLQNLGGGKYDAVLMQERYKLLNGENPYQIPADFMAVESSDTLSIERFNLITHNTPCFTNMADFDCIVETFCKISLAFYKNKNKIPFIAIAAKHGNACGVGTDWQYPLTAIRKALWGNPLAIWGGEFIVNFPLTKEAADMLYANNERKQKFGGDKWMLDIIISPAISEDAYDILSKRKNTKIFTNKALSMPALPAAEWSYRFVRGGILRQPLNSYILDLQDVKWVAEPMSDEQVDSAIIAWGCSFTSFHGGNEVVVARDGRLLGIGGGPSTVDAAEIAISRSLKYNHSLADAVFGADAFFPFTDAPSLLVDAGCVAGVVPSGGRNKIEVENYFLKNKIKVAFIDEIYRGFCRH